VPPGASLRPAGSLTAASHCARAPASSLTGEQRRYGASGAAPAPEPLEAPLEASCAGLCAVLAAAGLGLGTVLLASQSASKALSNAESISPGDFEYIGGSPGSAVYGYRGTERQWQGKTLRFRVDDVRGGDSDAVATKILGGRFAAQSEVVHLGASAVGALDHSRDTGLSKASAAAGRGGVPALRLADALDAVPAAARDGPVLTLELAPGSGLAELYGNPANFKVQEESILRQEEVAQRGGYSAHDLYSGRSKHMSRALAALEESPGDRLRALVDGKPEENTSAALPSALAALGFPSLGAALEVFSVVLNGEGAPLLVDLQRAQCGAAGTVLAEAAAELRDVLRRHADTSRAAAGARRELESAEAELDEALRRGFWTTPADESGMHLRQREAERLQERARRELWVEGSVSRNELEKQIRNFLLRYRLGVAASQARLRLSLVKPVPGAAGEEALRQLRFAPVGPAAANLWYRLDLTALELPPSV